MWLKVIRFQNRPPPPIEREKMKPSKLAILTSVIVSPFGLFENFREPRQKETRSPELVAQLQEAAQAKRDRKNLKRAKARE